MRVVMRTPDQGFPKELETTSMVEVFLASGGSFTAMASDICWGYLDQNLELLPFSDLVIGYRQLAPSKTAVTKVRKIVLSDYTLCLLVETMVDGLVTEFKLEKVSH